MLVVNTKGPADSSNEPSEKLGSCRNYWTFISASWNVIMDAWYNSKTAPQRRKRTSSESPGVQQALSNTPTLLSWERAENIRSAHTLDKVFWIPSPLAGSGFQRTVYSPKLGFIIPHLVILFPDLTCLIPAIPLRQFITLLYILLHTRLLSNTVFLGRNVQWQ